MQRTKEEWQQIFPRYPTTPDGFVRSFALEEAAQYTAALEEYGVVVVRVLDEDTCQKTVAAMFEELNSMVKKVTLRPDDPSTWQDAYWPARSKFLVSRPALHPQAFLNRSDARIYEVFTTLWKETRLRVTIDNWGLVRGTKDIPIRQKDGSTTREEKPKWGQPIQPHMDYNPWLFVKERAQGFQPGYQGLVALNEQPEEVGCHLTLPGGTKFLQRFCQERTCPEELGEKRLSYRPAPDDPIREYMQPIPLRRGEMVIWSWGQIHGSIPNHSTKMRLHQYIRMFPAKEVSPFYEENDRYAPGKILQKYSSLIDIKALPIGARGRKLLGVEAW